MDYSLRNYTNPFLFNASELSNAEITLDYVIGKLFPSTSCISLHGHH